MRILVTSGGTEEPVDAVRFLGNRSTGALGARLAEEAVRRYHTVDLLAGRTAIAPAPWAMDTGLLRLERYGSAADLDAAIVRLLAQGRHHAVIHAAAVADFRPRPVTGKIRSDEHETLTLELDRVPKIAPCLRKRAPEALIVVFKLEAVESPEELFVRARRTLAASRADLVVANPVTALGSGAHPAWVLTADAVLSCTSTKEELASVLLDRLWEALQDRTRAGLKPLPRNEEGES